MAYSRKNKLANYLIYLFLIVFPLGQLLRKTVQINDIVFSLNSSDFVVGLIFIYSLFSKFKFLHLSVGTRNLVYAILFSYIFSLFLFGQEILAIGGLYLVRLLLYINFFYFCRYFLVWKKEFLLKILILITAVTALFGWIQYIFWPDLRYLYLFGWDDHYYRLVGSFLDPGFTGIILVLGATVVLFKYLIKKEGKLLPLLLFFILSIAFTYSRASYLSFLGVLVYFALSQKKYLKSAVIALFLLAVIYFLPKPGGEGVNLARKYSISARYENYKETISIFKISPLFGVGYNNVCWIKQNYFGKENGSSHSCSGSDSSVLLVLATTGVVGFLIILNTLKILFLSIKDGYYKNIFIASSAALFVHSFFHNSLFYSWVMGYFAILLSLQNIKE